jgi:hypothetical protein
MSNLGKEEEEAIREKLQKMILCVGIGNEDSACSLAAINLALSGRLTDEIPDCMSEVIGSWIIRVQDEMPADMRNSAKWKALLPHAAGTGSLYEKQRIALILDWVWCKVVPALVPYADRNGFLADLDAVRTLRTIGAVDIAITASKQNDHTKFCVFCLELRTVIRDASHPRWPSLVGYEAASIAALACFLGGTWEAFEPCELLENLINVDPSFYADGEVASPAT